MMPAGATIDQVTPGITIWHQYDPRVKADLFSTAIATSAGIYLVDPIPWAPSEQSTIVGGESVAGIIVTNANHARAAQEFAATCRVPVYAHRDAGLELAPGVRDITADGSSVPGLETLWIEGAPPGEIALYCDSEGGTLIVGDALINMGNLGFSFLPAKYCTNLKVMRRSLRRLLAYRFERLLFAHGIPIVSRAQSRLAALLESKPA